MNGLPLRAVQLIERMIDGTFDSLSLRFLGIVPKLTREKRIVFSTTKDSLTSLFLTALGTKDPTKSEEEALKTLLKISNSYIESLRERTKAKVISSVDSYVKNQTSKDNRVSMGKIKSIYRQEMKRAKGHFKMIANSESNKCGNTATALQISKMAEQEGEKDPTVFFSVIIDDVTGKEEFKLHLLPDRKTPRVWFLSEIGAEYHKKGDSNPKLAGLHPNCRCKLTYSAPGWGFTKDGKVTYIGPDHDEISKQREEYGKPS